MTLEGTNTYLYGSGPCLVVDPGPDDPGHLAARGLTDVVTPDQVLGTPSGGTRA